jgi:hypothetical protein
MKALLVRIGVDQAYAGWNAPVDAEGRFVYVPIPEKRGTRFHPGLERRYGEVLPALQRFCGEHDCDLGGDLRFPQELLEQPRPSLCEESLVPNRDSRVSRDRIGEPSGSQCANGRTASQQPFSPCAPSFPSPTASACCWQFFWSLFAIAHILRSWFGLSPVVRLRNPIESSD